MGVRELTKRVDALEAALSAFVGLPGKSGTLAAYRLLSDIPGVPAGTVFVHDPDDSVKGSIGHGSLHNAWDRGNCQASWCGGTHVFPGQMARDPRWFQRVPNDGRYTSGVRK